MADGSHRAGPRLAAVRQGYALQAGQAVDYDRASLGRFDPALVAQARKIHPVVATGQFAADMQVHLVNDGPVTIPLRMPPAAHQN